MWKSKRDLLDRIEHLAYENAQLKKRIGELEDDNNRKYSRIGNLLKDNVRLIAVNAYLANMAGKKPATRRVDDCGDEIKTQFDKGKR